MFWVVFGLMALWEMLIVDNGLQTQIYKKINLKRENLHAIPSTL